MKKLEEQMKTKEQAEEFLRDTITKYLENLQSGNYGVPSMEELLNAANLHVFLEKM